MLTSSREFFFFATWLLYNTLHSFGQAFTPFLTRTQTICLGPFLEKRAKKSKNALKMYTKRRAEQNLWNATTQMWILPNVSCATSSCPVEKQFACVIAPPKTRKEKYAKKGKNLRLFTKVSFSKKYKMCKKMRILDYATNSNYAICTFNPCNFSAGEIKLWRKNSYLLLQTSWDKIYSAECKYWGVGGLEWKILIPQTFRSIVTL